MLDTNPGFQKLSDLVSHLGPSGQDAMTFKHWVDRRQQQVYKELNRLSETSHVSTFIDGYASELADSLTRLLVADVLTEPAETVIDYMEELFSQAEYFSKLPESVTTVPASEPTIVQSDTLLSPSESFAFAA